MLEPPTQNITTHSTYAAILDHFFQPPTAETKILCYSFTKESLKNVYMMPFLTTREVKLQIFQYKITQKITKHPSNKNIPVSCEFV